MCVCVLTSVFASTCVVSEFSKARLWLNVDVGGKNPKRFLKCTQYLEKVDGWAEVNRWRRGQSGDGEVGGERCGLGGPARGCQVE